jgi:hypothetical protein
MKQANSQSNMQSLQQQSMPLAYSYMLRLWAVTVELLVYMQPLNYVQIPSNDISYMPGRSLPGCVLENLHRIFEGSCRFVTSESIRAFIPSVTSRRPIPLLCPSFRDANSDSSQQKIVFTLELFTLLYEAYSISIALRCNMSVYYISSPFRVSEIH